MIIYKQSRKDFDKLVDSSKFLSNNIPDISDVLINVEELIGMVDDISDSVNSQNDYTFFLTFQNFFIRNLFDNLLVVLSLFGNKVIEEFFIERELIK